MAKIRKIYDQTVKPNGEKTVIYPITSTRAVYTPTSVSIDTILNEGYRFGGVVLPTDSPAITDQRVFYGASVPGIYPSFGGISVDGGEAIFLMWDGSSWHKGIFGGAGSNNLTGFKSLASISELPLEETMYGYLIDDYMYVWVGENGDTLDGKYQNVGQLRGASAYEVAVRDGYEGTEEQWLNDPVNGIKGNGIKSWSVQQSTEDSGVSIITVEFYEGSSETFTVKNGKGITGVTPVSISTQNGGVSTYRINYSDNTYFDIQIRNGKCSAGFFATASELTSAISSPNVGDYAFVSKAGDASFPAYIYVCTTAGVWTATTEEFTPDDPTYVEDSLNSSSSTAALSANQGKVLDGKITQLGQEVDDIYNLKTIADKFTFGGVSNIITFNAISLSEAGDAIEFRAKTALNDANKAYCFAMNGENIGISLHSYLLGVKNASGTWLTGMNASSGQYNFNSAGAGTISSSYKTFKLLRTANSLEIYIDGTKYTEVSGTPTITIDRLGGVRNSDYWSGDLEFFRYVHNGAAIELLDLPGYTASGDITVTTHTEESGLLTTKVDKIEGKGLSSNDFSIDEKSVLDFAVDLGWGWKFNGVDSYLTLSSPITLSSNGDSVEWELIVNSAGDELYAAYPFCYGGRDNGLGIGISKSGFAAISDDGTWLILASTFASADRQTIKIEYTSGNILFYRNGVLVKTYEGQKNLTIKGFGNGVNGTYGYWNGVILSMKHNGVIYNLSAATTYKVSRDRIGGFLTPSQEQLLDKILPPIIVEPNTTSSFFIHVLNRATGKYVKHSFLRAQGTRTINNVEYNCMDVWNAEEVIFNGSNVFQGNLNMIYRIGSVNGTAASDASVNENYHVGASHGCEVMQMFKFFADGKEFVPGEDTELIYCSTFRAIWKSTCYVTDSSQNTGNANNYPKIVDGEMVAHGIHYIDATYKENNVIDYTNRLVQVRDATVQYAMLCGGMVQGYTSHIDHILLNDIDNSWNKFVEGVSVPTYSVPTGYSCDILYGRNKQANVAIMYGDSAIIRHEINNKDNSMRDHAFIYVMSNNGVSAKCYLQPIIPFGFSSADSFSAGDVIDVVGHREIEITL